MPPVDTQQVLFYSIYYDTNKRRHSKWDKKRFEYRCLKLFTSEWIYRFDEWNRNNFSLHQCHWGNLYSFDVKIDFSFHPKANWFDYFSNSIVNFISEMYQCSDDGFQQFYNSKKQPFVYVIPFDIMAHYLCIWDLSMRSMCGRLEICLVHTVGFSLSFVCMIVIKYITQD